MSNKFPGFVQITPEHARAIQFDVQLYCIFLSDDDKLEYTPTNFEEPQR